MVRCPLWARVVTAAAAVGVVALATDNGRLTTDNVNQVLVILHEDPHCLAVVKPPGQFTQGTWAPPDEITLETAVRQYLNPGDPSSVYLGIVHRLDRPDVGRLDLGQDDQGRPTAFRPVQRRRVVKEYWAIVESRPEQRGAGTTGEETWTDWLTAPTPTGSSALRRPHTPGAREAITKVRFEAAGSLASQFTWLRLWPQTGRTHQLRAQAAARGMPILGDSTYGSTIPPRCREESRFTHAHFRSATPSPAPR